MGTTPTITTPSFNGSSKYSSDFQQVLQRAVSIASLPLQQMNNEVAVLQSQKTSLNGLESTFGSLESSISGLAASAQGSVSASISNPSIIQATASSNTLPGTYTITVTSLGSRTTTLSQVGSPAVADPTSQNISSSSTFTLTINGTGHTITPSGNSLESLAAAVNSAGLGVSATIVNVGSNASADYRLAVTSNNLAPDTIQLNDGSTDLLTNTGSPGTPATYLVNGLNTPIDSSSTNVTLAPGLTVNLLEAAPTTPVTITVAQNLGSLANSLNNFANAYNAAVNAVNQQHGANAGTLLGSGVVFSLGQTLQSLTQYSSGSGNVRSLADLGLTVANSGALIFDPGALTALNPTDVTQFLGDLTSGGFLQTANGAVAAMQDPSTGAIHQSLTSIQTQITNENAKIASQTSQINTMATQLQQQLAAADASIVVLQQQVTLLSGLFTAQYTGYNYSNNSNSA